MELGMVHSEALKPWRAQVRAVQVVRESHAQDYQRWLACVVWCQCDLRRFGLEDGQKEATPRGFGKSRRAEHGR